MHLVLPAARGLRTLYAIGSDRLWFTLAVPASLAIASRLAGWLMTAATPVIEGGFGL